MIIYKTHETHYIFRFFWFFFFSNSGCAIIKPDDVWQDWVSQVAIFLYFWHGTFFNKKVAPVLAVTECYRCDNIHMACERVREREQKSEKRICLWHLWGIDRAVRRGVRKNPIEQALLLSLCLLFSKKINGTEEHIPKEAGATFQWKAMSGKLNVTEADIAPVEKTKVANASSSISRVIMVRNMGMQFRILSNNDVFSACPWTLG